MPGSIPWFVNNVFILAPIPIQGFTYPLLCSVLLKFAPKRCKMQLELYRSEVAVLKSWYRFGTSGPCIERISHAGFMIVRSVRTVSL